VNAITQLDLLDLETLTDHYPIGKLVRYQAIAAGIENSNYFLTTVLDGIEHHYVLTILEQPANAGAALVPLLDACESAGLPVPAVVRSAEGRAWGELSGKPTLICRFLPGRHVANPTDRQIEALGRFIGRFHNATASLHFPMPAYPRDADWLARQASACRGYIGYGPGRLMQDAAAQVARGLDRMDVRELPRGAIHGDLFRDNVLFNEHGLSGVLDFHHAADGYLLYDLAVVANDWCTDAQGVMDPERVLALLLAYHGVRPLLRQELWHFPLFCLYAGLAFWLSRYQAGLRKRRNASVRVKNPEEFQRIVEHHAGHFLYLDERLFL
jgi:homoserine kinase type II